ncbi:helix-turn-helix domain-containing protein [Thiothrix eikelboomii]|uniref:helix-turn-helix domain-containing protein n=1 Tax=Thiothrix eikelboomii TaxID=92487 RepID=UPI003BB0A7FF
MNKKKATPKAADQTPNHDSNSHPLPKPKSQREYRLLSALVKGEVMRYELDLIIGAQNSPEYVSRLRMAGWDIRTERIPMIDRDGHKVRVGRYRLSSEHVAVAVNLLGG